MRSGNLAGVGYARPPTSPTRCPIGR
jgi:hypothetical protein